MEAQLLRNWTAKRGRKMRLRGSDTCPLPELASGRACRACSCLTSPIDGHGQQTSSGPNSDQRRHAHLEKQQTRRFRFPVARPSWCMNRLGTLVPYRPQKPSIDQYCERVRPRAQVSQDRELRRGHREVHLLDSACRRQRFASAASCVLRLRFSSRLPTR
jgi:hypothetical protein